MGQRRRAVLAAARIGAPAHLLLDEPLEAMDRGAREDILAWIASEGDGIILVYGGYDPWTGGAIPLGGAADSESFLAPTANHGAMAADLTMAEQQRFVSRLESWVGVRRARRAAVAIPHRPLPRRQWTLELPGHDSLHWRLLVC